MYLKFESANSIIKLFHVQQIVNRDTRKRNYLTDPRGTLLKITNIIKINEIKVSNFN